MRQNKKIAVIIPARDEESSIGQVLDDIPDWVDRVILVDNGSVDRTTEIASDKNAHVVSEPVRGYGRACQRGIAELGGEDIIVFLDGDYSDYPEEMHKIVDPILENKADLVIGSRLLSPKSAAFVPPQARYGNIFACFLIKLFFGIKYSDLGPFRAITRDALARLRMEDLNFGWTVEMQVKAAVQDLRTLEVPVGYRHRIGKSKISGTLKGVIGAGTKIIYTILKLRWKTWIN